MNSIDGLLVLMFGILAGWLISRPRRGQKQRIPVPIRDEARRSRRH